MRGRILAAGAFLLAFLAAQLWPQATAPGTDKDWHALLYFGLAVVLWPLVPPAQPSLRALALVLGGATLAAFIEAAQGHIPGRTADAGDWLADVVGLVAAAVALVVGGWGALPRPVPDAPGVPDRDSPSLAPGPDASVSSVADDANEGSVDVAAGRPGP